MKPSTGRTSSWFIKHTPIERITPNGLVVAGKEYPVDAIVFATGFDANSGPILRIDIRGAMAWRYVTSGRRGRAAIWV